VCSTAEGVGHLSLFGWARAQDPPCPWNELVCSAAAGGGHLQLLQWARAQGCPWSVRVGDSAALGGHLEVLRWMRAQDPPCCWHSGICEAAASEGHLGVLQWARAQVPPCPWDEGACRAAANAQQFEALSWLRAQRPPCPWWKGTWHLVARCCPSFLGEAGPRPWARAQEKALDGALARVALAAPGRGAPSIRLGRRGAGEDEDEDADRSFFSEAAECQLAFFGSAEGARAYLQRYVLAHLHEVFVDRGRIIAWIADEEFDPLEGVKLVADRSVQFRLGTDGAAHLSVLDLARAAENGGYPTYDDWNGSRTELTKWAANDALRNLKHLVGFAQTWLRAELPGCSVCRLSALEYAGRPEPPMFSSLVLTFAFPEFPEPTGRLPLPPSEEWR
jgi:hypothetical protein